MTKTTKPPTKRQSTKKPKWAAKISDVADVVVEMFSDDLPKGAKLDFSENSIKSLDKVITSVWGKQGPSDDSRDAMVWALGCYIAEVIQRHYEGTWTDSPDGYSFECSRSGAGVSPWNWIAKRFEFGKIEALAPKYNLAQSMLDKDRKSLTDSKFS